MNIKTENKLGAVFLSLAELGFILLLAYILHKFLQNNMTVLEVLFIYGLIGFLASFVLDNKIEKILITVLIIAVLAPLPYLFFTLGIYCFYRFAFDGVFRIKIHDKKYKA